MMKLSTALRFGDMVWINHAEETIEVCVAGKTVAYVNVSRTDVVFNLCKLMGWQGGAGRTPILWKPAS